MPPQLDSAVVRIRSRSGAVVGAGFLVGERQVLTCAHVVAEALNLPREAPSGPGPDHEVRIDFPLVPGSTGLTAHVVLWVRPTADGGGDIAGLELNAPPPSGARAVRPLHLNEPWQQPVRVFGFPHGYDGGVWVEGRLLGRQGTGWVQLGTIRGGYRIGPGFSGAPVWNDVLNGVVGITVAAERDPHVPAAFLIPTAALLEAWPALQEQAISPAPYRALDAFRPEHAHLYFGREELTAQLVRVVTSEPTVVVVGASGSGKSSLVFAGLIPALQQRGSHFVALRPGDRDPFRALAATLLPSLEPEMSEASRLRELPNAIEVLKDGGLRELADRVRERTGTRRLLLVVDQFEELYAQDDQNIARRFTDALLDASTGGNGGAMLTEVFTLRADFLDRALEHERLTEALQRAPVFVGPMTKEQLRAAIERPVEGLVAFEQGLVERILDDVGEASGNLPLLEFALEQLWEQQANGWLTHEAYTSLGGVGGALSYYAVEMYNHLSGAEQERARRLFVQLVRPDEGARYTRSVPRRSELGEPLWQLAQRLATTRLITVDRDAAGRQTVELAHEALISGWKTLGEWVTANSEFRGWQEGLRISLRRWEASGRDRGGLLRGAPLVEAEHWAAERPDEIGPAEREFIRDSRIFEDRQVRRLKRLVATLTVLSILALVGGIASYSASRAARRESNRATSRQLAAEAVANVNKRPLLGLLQSLRALHTDDTAEAESALFAALEREPRLAAFLPASDTVRSVAFSGDDHTLAVATTDGAVTLWDYPSRRQLGRLLARGTDALANRGLESLAFSPDRRTLATGSTGGTVALWDAATRRDLGVLGKHAGLVRALAFSPDGKTLASGGGDGRIILWDLRRRQPLRELPNAHVNGVEAVAFSPDGKMLASGGGDGRVVLWQLGRQRPIASVLAGHTGVIRTIAFSPNGHTLASGGNDAKLIFWDVTRKRMLGRPLSGDGSVVWSVSFSPSGELLAAATFDGRVILWDVVRRRMVGDPLTGHTGVVRAVAFSPDGKTIASGSSDKTVILWDADFHHALGQAVIRHRGAVKGITFSPDGRLLASASSDGTVIIWDARRREPLATLHPPSRTGMTGVAFSPDGKTVAAGGGNGVVTLWDLASGRPTELVGRTGIAAIAFSPDDRLLAAGGNDGTVALWDPRSRLRLATLHGHAEVAASLDFARNGRVLASGSSDGTVILWDMAERRPRTAPLRSFADRVRSVAFSPSGGLLAGGTDNGAVILWEWDRRQPAARATLTGHTAGVWTVAFSPNGRTLASGSSDKTLLLWDVQRRRMFGSPLAKHTADVRGAAFSPDGRTLVSGGDDGVVVFWNVSLWQLPADAWSAHGCQIIDPLLHSDAPALSDFPVRGLCR